MFAVIFFGHIESIANLLGDETHWQDSPLGRKIVVLKNLVLAQPLVCVTLGRPVFKSLQWRQQSILAMSGKRLILDPLLILMSLHTVTVQS